MESEVITFRVTERQKKLIETAAKLLNVSTSEFIREAIQEVIDKVKAAEVRHVDPETPHADFNLMKRACGCLYEARYDLRPHKPGGWIYKLGEPCDAHREGALRAGWNKNREFPHIEFKEVW